MNYTDDPSYSMAGAEIVEVILLGLVCVIGTIGNLLVVVAVITTPSLQVRQNVFILVLAITDLINTGISTPFFMICLVHGGWPYKEEACIFIGYVTILCLTTSGLTVNCIAVCRYVTVAYTNPVRRKVIHGRVVIAASAALIFIVISAVLLPVFGFGNVGFNEKLGHCSLKYENQFEWYYGAMMFVIGLICTVTIVPVSYTLIFWIVRKSKISIENMTLASRNDPCNDISKKPKADSPKISNPRRNMSRDELRLSKKLLMLYGLFLFCWVPYTSVLLADKNGTVPKEAHRATNFLLWMNACLNPFLYAWMIQNYRQAYKRILSKLFCQKRFW
ncbi:G-protein coupled receptor moody-like [Lytechinus variegatus]|uniref:G-protein coupled receptor moody-like n=1 Tax=Lytechinus variegatus TaxID=7654 RepID=UPI001BB2A719|nr:G-protein coupled receptor moody-like [Lytechinus variegatus]